MDISASSRGCPSPLVVGQQAMDWFSYLFGSKRSSNGDDGPGIREIIEACCPTYLPTTVAKLERNRQNLTLALAGQLSVVICRVLTGHLGGGVVGLIVFVVGNNARCSLQASNLTCYVALGFCAGAMDLFDLFQHFVGGSSIFALPFLDNMAQDLQALSLFTAPICEIGGARIAWDSYLSPAMLFEAGGSTSSHMPMASTANCFGSPIWMPQLHHASPYQSMPPMYGAGVNPMETRMPASGWPMESMFAGWPGIDAYMRPDAPADYSRCGGESGMRPWNSENYRSHGYHNQLGYWRHRGGAASGGDAASGPSSPPRRNRTNPMDSGCTECAAHVSAGDGWLGTSEYAGQVYCNTCWENWQSQS